MLLIDALKLDTEYKSNSMEELLISISENGGKLFTFNYYVDELCGIIEKYLSSPDSKIFLDLDFYRRNKIHSSQIILQEAKLKSASEQLGKILLPFNNIEINILDTISYDDLISKQKWHINSNLLENKINKTIKYTNKSSLQNDIKTIERILYEKNIKNKKIIFLSSNNKLISVAKQFTETKNKNLFYTDIDLAALLWLSNYNSKSKLSELALLQNAYAALNPTKEVIDEVVKMIESNINSTDEELKKQALILRYDENLLSRVSQVYQNDKNNLNLKTQDDLMKQLYNEISSKLKDSIETKVENEYKQKNKQIKEEQYKNEQITKKNSRKTMELDKREIDLNRRENTITIIQHEKNILNETLLHKNIELEKIKTLTKNKFKKISNLFGIFLHSLFILVCTIILLYLITPWINNCFQNLTKDNTSNNIYQISNFVAYIITIISLIVIYKNFTRKVCKKAQEYIYHLLCKHSKILNNK